MRWYHLIGRLFVCHFLLVIIPFLAIHQFMHNVYDEVSCKGLVRLEPQQCLICKNKPALLCKSGTPAQVVSKLVHMTFRYATLAPLSPIVFTERMLTGELGEIRAKQAAHIVALIWWLFAAYCVGAYLKTTLIAWLKSKGMMKGELNSNRPRWFHWVGTLGVIYIMLAFLPYFAFIKFEDHYPDECRYMLQQQLKAGEEPMIDVGQCGVCERGVFQDYVCNEPSIIQKLKKLLFDLSQNLFWVGVFTITVLAIAPVKYLGLSFLLIPMLVLGGIAASVCMGSALRYWLKRIKGEV